MLAGQYVALTYGNDVDIVKMVIVPIVAGLYLTGWPGQGKVARRCHAALSMCCIGLIITIITAAGRDQLLPLGWPHCRVFFAQLRRLSARLLECPLLRMMNVLAGQ
jgi:predicted Na+-dependent transporter